MNIKRKIKHIIRWFTPYGVVRFYARIKHSHVNSEPKISLEKAFVLEYIEYIQRKSRVEFIDQSPFSTIVAVQGFGFSGSGAVVDLLREYDSTLVLGGVDREGSITSIEQSFGEVDVLRLAGGLFEVEKYLGSNNIFQNDALLHRVISQIANSEIYRSLSATHPYFYEYISQICDVLTNSPQWQYYNTFLEYREVNDIFYLKDITLKNYRNLCRKLLNSLFTIIKRNSKSSILVLDQFVSDVEFEINRYIEYVPNIKLITVYRDPRDVYAFAIKDNVEWIPHSNVDVFIQWYQIIVKHFNENEKDKYQVVQFEQLIENYESVVKSIEHYVGLNASSHVQRNACFNPSVSCKNMYLWKQNTADVDSYVEIKNQLDQLCYNN